MGERFDSLRIDSTSSLCKAQQLRFWASLGMFLSVISDPPQSTKFFDCRAAVDSDWTLFGDFDELAASNSVAHSTWNDTFGDWFMDPTIGSLWLRSWFFLGDCSLKGPGVRDLVSAKSIEARSSSR